MYQTLYIDITSTDMVLALLPHGLLGIGYSEVALETESVFCRIALWDSVYPGRLCTGTWGSLSNDDGDSNENGKKRNRFRLAKQQLCTYSTFFCTFLYLHRTTTTRKCLILRFVEDVNTTERLSFFLSWTSIQSFIFQLQLGEFGNIWRPEQNGMSSKQWNIRRLNFSWD